MNFSNIKAITIPEGNVKQIIVNGIVIWELASIVTVVSISTAGQTTSYYVGDTFSYNGTCTATYSDGTTAIVTPTVSSPDMSSAGTKTVTLSYTENGTTVTTSYNITVTAVTLTSITISGQTTSLARGSTFSFGGTVTAHYNNSSTADVTSSSTFSGYNMNTAGTYTVTVKYVEGGITKTTTYSLTVTKAWTALWSGTKQISWNLSNSRPSDVDVYSNSSLPNPSNIRITFTISNKQGNAGDYIVNGSHTSTKPTSPKQFSSFNPTSGVVLLGVTGKKESTGGTKTVGLQWSSLSNKFYLYASDGTGVMQSSGTISLKITKIERYY